MIQPQELRLGNIIEGKYTNEEWSDEEDNYIDIQQICICKVVALDSAINTDYSITVETDDNIEYFDDFVGIPLTEEWLLKFGFSQEYKSQYTIENKSTLRWKGDPLKVNSVHQLQNVFFSLTQEELILTD